MPLLICSRIRFVGLRNGQAEVVHGTETVEVVRIVLGAGKQLREHSAPGEITLQCIEGRIAFSTAEASHVLETGYFIHLRRGEPHALEAIIDSSALLTLCIARPT